MFPKILILCVTVFVLFNCTGAQRDKTFFRKDYTYIQDTESFYKIHTIHKTWLEAKKTCALEGADFFYPENDHEAYTVLGWWNATQPFYWVYIGVSDLVAKGVFETVDGLPILDVYSNWGPGEPNDAGGVEDCVIMRRDGTLNDDKCNVKQPFICKKSLVSLEWNIQCAMPNLDYQLSPETGKCYKLHQKPMNWTDAHAVCSAEQSYLAVINSKQEADLLSRIVGTASITAVHIGYHNRLGEGWSTVRGTSLEDSGYAVWSENQPDGGDVEQCGSMLYNGELNDIKCNSKCLFICEHDVATATHDDRFGEIDV